MVFGNAGAMTGRRFQGPRPPRHSSTFTDQATAERVILGLVEREATMVSVWLASDQKRLHLDGVTDDVTGLSMERGGLAAPVRGLRVVLEQSCHTPDGFVVMTAYPTP